MPVSREVEHSGRCALLVATHRTTPFGHGEPVIGGAAARITALLE